MSARGLAAVLLAGVLGVAPRSADAEPCTACFIVRSFDKTLDGARVSVDVYRVAVAAAIQAAAAQAFGGGTKLSVEGLTIQAEAGTSTVAFELVVSVTQQAGIVSASARGSLRGRLQLAASADQRVEYSIRLDSISLGGGPASLGGVVAGGGPRRVDISGLDVGIRKITVTSADANWLALDIDVADVR